MSNIKDAKKLVRNSSPLARLPHASLEGLKLLRDCWDEFDVTMHLSNLYKIATQIAHFILLLGAVVIIVLVAIESRSVVVETVLEHNSTATDIWEGKYLWPTFWFEGTAEALRHTTFALTLWTTFAYGTIALINPRARWQHLRIHARALESIIWAYRTRTGVFTSDPQAQANADEESRGSLPLPEDRALTAALVAWREGVIHSGDLGLVRVLGY